MSDLDAKARALAAYAELDKELRGRKLQAIWACMAAILFASALVFYFYGTQPAGPAVPRPGTVIRTMHVADDTMHDVRLVVALDLGPSVLVPASKVVPLGARVIIGERKSPFGWSRYAFIGHESEPAGRRTTWE